MGMPETGDEMWQFIHTSELELLKLEARYGVSQVDVVNELIELTCWRNDASIVPFRNGHGSDSERLCALRAAFNSPSIISK